jgi:hypothetical protein
VPTPSPYTDIIAIATSTCTPMASSSLSAQGNLQLVPIPLN